MVLFKLVNVKRSLLLSVIIISIIVTGIGGYFIVTELIITDNIVLFHDFSVSATI